MSRHNDVHSSMWSDPDVLALSVGAKALLLWSFTNPRCGVGGIYRITVGQIRAEVGGTEEEITGWLEELRASRFVFYEAGWLWVRTRVKYYGTQTLQTATSAVRDLRELPAGHPFGAMFCAEYGGADEWGKASHRGVLADLLDEAKDERPDWNGEGPERVNRGSKGARSNGESRPSRVPLPRDSGSGSRSGHSSPTSRSSAASRARARPAATIRFGGAPVPRRRREVAERLLDCFNEKAGTGHGAYTGRGQASESLKRIIGALTDHPDVSEERWRQAIDARLADPFWSGRPDTGVVFGPGVVSANLENATPAASGGHEALNDRVRG